MGYEGNIKPLWERIEILNIIWTMILFNQMKTKFVDCQRNFDSPSCLDSYQIKKSLMNLSMLVIMLVMFLV